MAITRAQQYRQMLREGSVAMQGGVKNYLGKQKTVSDVPVKWQSGKDKPSTELAYITNAEKKLLLKEDIHGSLKDGPNTGPEGIMSLDSQGDMGGSEDKGTNADGSNNPGYDAQADMTDYATNVGKTAKSKGGFKGDGGGIKDFLSNLPSVKAAKFGLDLLGRAFNEFGKTRTADQLQDRVGYGADYQGERTTESFDDNDMGDGDGGQNIIPLMAQAPVTSGAVEEDTDVVTSAPRIAYRLMNEGGMADDRMPYEGGIMDLESARQMYGLGKLVKKVTRSVKKIAKSPIGKAAIIGAGIYGLGGGFGLKPGGFSFGNLPGAGFVTGAGASAKAKAAAAGLSPRDYMMGIGGKTSSSGILGNIFGGKSGLAMAGIGALSALPLLGVGVEEDEEQEEFSPYLGEGLDIAAIRANPRKYQGQAYRLFSDGGNTEDAETEEAPDLSNDPNYKGWVKVYETNPDAAEMNENHSKYLSFYNRKAEGGSMKEPVAKKVMPLLDMDGQEKDYRETGGFVDMGRMEKADDVPARLSKNEFVFTADAVRNAGEGNVDKGAEVMYNMMKNLESGGDVSEESQGLEGARDMFKTSQRLEEVL